jgi:NADPH-dependent 2,4-dienoyl-CoA reductase/sulfur reductase-like enzyme/rhodanese-related sulfurtransferase
MIRDTLDDVESVGVIGGGFIGVELAENLVKRGKKVTLFEYRDHILANLDPDIISYLEDQLRSNGVELLTSARIFSVSRDEKGYTVEFDNGSFCCVDYIVMAAGLLPSTGFLEDSGISLDDQGYIEVDQHMRTNTDGVYAAGDAVSVINLVTGKKAHIPLAGPANRQGRIIADNLCGIESRYEGSLGTSIIRGFGLSGASVGLNTAQILKEYGKCETICTHPSSHATYYPGSSPIHIKLFYDKETRKIYGAQAVGKEGVDKFIDVIATVMMLKGTVDDLAKLEQAYAPPFLSAKSPANYLGFVAGNEKEGLEELVTVEQALTDGNVLLDVRTDREYSMGAFKDSIHIPVDELRDRIDELSQYKDKIIDVYCAVGVRGHIACRILRAYGFKARNITGAYTTYKAMKLKD